MKTIIVASNNPVKINATRHAFEQLFQEEYEVLGSSVPSGVSAQPMTNQETLQGAMNRAHHCREKNPQADFWVGIEGGIDDIEGRMAAFAWVVILSDEMLSKSRTGFFYLPEPVIDLIHQGKEMGDADDIVFHQHNSKQNNGAIGLLSGDIMTRTEYYIHALILALLPFKNPELYQDMKLTEH